MGNICPKSKFETPLSKKHGVSLAPCLHPPTVVLSVPPSSVHAVNWAVAQHSLHEALMPMGEGEAGLCSLNHSVLKAGVQGFG